MLVCHCRQAAPVDGPDRLSAKHCSSDRCLSPVPHTDRDHSQIDALVLRFQTTGDREALDAVMAEFDWLAVSCARRMRRRGESIEDLEQVAREALLGAMTRFDVDRGVPFKAFAWATTIGVLRHHYRNGWQVRVPRGLQELHLAVVKATEELVTSSGRAPTVDAIALHLGADRDDVLLALEAGHAYRAGSLDDPSTNARSRSGRGAGTLSRPDEALENLAERAHVHELLASLPSRDQEILVMRFFEDRTQDEIGRSLGVSQVHVSRLMRAALTSLRNAAGDARAAEPLSPAPS